MCPFIHYFQAIHTDMDCKQYQRSLLEEDDEDTKKTNLWIKVRKRRNKNLTNPTRGVMILALDPDPEYDFKLFGNSGSRFGSSKKRNHNTYGGVITLAQDPDVPDPESDYQPFGDSGIGIRIQ